MDSLVTTVSLTRALVSCVVCIWLGCISVVPVTVRESATPDSKENKQADAGSYRFSKAFSLRRSAWNNLVRNSRLSKENMNTHIYIYIYIAFL